MKFARFEVVMNYILTSAQEGSQIKQRCDPAAYAVEPLFSALENSFIYLPIDEKEFVHAACAEFSRNSLPTPHEFSAPIQYFVNSQLHYTTHQAVGRRWPVEREVRYSATSKHTADLRIAVKADECTDLYHEPFNIWIESDHARDARVLDKNWYKVLVALDSRSAGHDIFVQFLYRTGEFQKLNTLAAVLRRNFHVGSRSIGAKMSFVIAHVAPIRLRKPDVIESELVLFRGTSLRVNASYFHSWSADGDFQLLNEHVKRDDLPLPVPPCVTSA